MPELPEVETTKNALMPHLLNQHFTGLQVHQVKLRWQVPADLAVKICNQKIIDIKRIAKYLLLQLSNGSIIIHLGMSGKLRFVDTNKNQILAEYTDKHTHLIFELENGFLLYHDPRRFGCVLWQELNQTHKLLATLGVEPLSPNWNGDYLFNATRNRKTNIKTLIMNQKIVVGIGNIYATEALFNAKIHPHQQANSLTKPQCKNLVKASIDILEKAIKCGGTTLKDFASPDNKLGYFSLQLQAYGKTNEPCPICTTPIERVKTKGRSDFFCSNCQKK